MGLDPELQQIKSMRKRIGITQQELAKAANVSQSLIAKVEAGYVDPSFSAGKRILSTLINFERKQEPTASELMRHQVITVKQEGKLKEAVKKMQNNGYSQLPVMNGTNVAGLLSERSILQQMELLAKEGTVVGDVMEEAPPVVPPEAPRKVVAELLAHYNLILVKEKGKVKGILTKADLLKI
jgi:predicted transcriptional regulator